MEHPFERAGEYLARFFGAPGRTHLLRGERPLPAR